RVRWRADVDGVGGHARRRAGQRAIGGGAEPLGDGSSEAGPPVDGGGGPSAGFVDPSRDVFGLGGVGTTGQDHVERHAVCSWRSYNRLSRLWQSRRCVALAPGCYAHLLDGCVRGLDRSFYAPAPGGVADDHDWGSAYPGGQPAATVAEHLEEQ